MLPRTFRPFMIELKMRSSLTSACHCVSVRSRAWLNLPFEVFAVGLQEHHTEGGTFWVLATDFHGVNTDQFLISVNPCESVAPLKLKAL